MEHETYTPEEVLSKLNILKTQEEKLLEDRKELNRVILDKRKSIKYWEELDLNQYKAF